jgi:hypothetical protein
MRVLFKSRQALSRLSKELERHGSTILPYYSFTNIKPALKCLLQSLVCGIMLRVMST